MLVQHLDTTTSIDILAKASNRAADEIVGTRELQTSDWKDVPDADPRSSREATNRRINIARKIIDDCWAKVVSHRSTNSGNAWVYALRFWQDGGDPAVQTNFILVRRAGQDDDDMLGHTEGETWRKMCVSLMKQLESVNASQHERTEAHMKSIDLVQQQFERTTTMTVETMREYWMVLQARVEAETPRAPFIDDDAAERLIALVLPLLLAYGLKHGIDFSAMFEAMGFDVGGLAEKMKQAARARGGIANKVDAVRRLKKTLTDAQRSEIVAKCGDLGADVLKVWDLVDDPNCTEEMLRDAFDPLKRQLKALDMFETLGGCLTSEQLAELAKAA